VCGGRSPVGIHSVWRALSCMYSRCVEGTLLYVFTVCGGRSPVCIHGVWRASSVCIHRMWRDARLYVFTVCRGQVKSSQIVYCPIKIHNR
jgi:hypothetical protein